VNVTVRKPNRREISNLQGASLFTHEERPVALCEDRKKSEGAKSCITSISGYKNEIRSLIDKNKRSVA
jgi:hypothetical protein